MEEFTWLNSSYNPVLKQLGSASVIDYYFGTHHSNSDPKFEVPKLKVLVYPEPSPVLPSRDQPKAQQSAALDEDIVVKKDLTGLWSP
ncbi:hypothetical protein M0R45_026439 [Rubus argutus]|uniref:Uncharacterized protein n=1 Tax=Rubus argutus TaxID=59490 RepID=A0AAW1WY54_RUBAR